MNTVPLVAAEVESLHRFIERWFNGSVARTHEVFARLSSAWPDGFTLIDPHNQCHASTDLLQSTYRLHGQFPGLAIEIKNMRVSARALGAVVAVYEEWHRDAEGVEARLCSATLAIDSACPEHLIWVHVHESSLVV